MKKVAVFIFLLILSLQTFAQVEQKFNLTYTGDKELWCSIEDKDGNYELTLQTTNTNSTCVYILSNTDDIIKFHEAMKNLKAKWLEYREIAIKNKVDDFVKKVDIEFPRMTLAWYWSEWYSGPRSKPEIFFSIQNGYYIMDIYKESASRTNSYIKEKADLILISEIDFDTLISLSDISNIKKKLSEDISELFK